MAFLVTAARVSGADALRFLSLRRPAVAPNPGFLRQLQLWEQQSAAGMAQRLLAAHGAAHTALAEGWQRTVSEALAGARDGQDSAAGGGSHDKGGGGQGDEEPGSEDDEAQGERDWAEFLSGVVVT